MPGRMTFSIVQDDAGRVLGKLRRDIPRDTEKLIRERTARMFHAISGSAPRRGGTLAQNVAMVTRPEFGLAGVRKGDAFYARFLEFGTARMDASPFVYPAFQRAIIGLADDLARRLDR